MLVRRSLSSLLHKVNRESGLTTNEQNSPSKRIKSPGGVVRFVPGYIDDYVEQGDRSATSFDIDKYAGNSNYRHERFGIIATKKKDSHFTAVHNDEGRKHKVKDRT